MEVIVLKMGVDFIVQTSDELEAQRCQLFWSVRFT